MVQKIYTETVGMLQDGSNTLSPEGLDPIKLANNIPAVPVIETHKL